MSFEKLPKHNLTSDELSHVFGLIALLEAHHANDRVFHGNKDDFEGVRSLDQSLEDYICDHDFMD